MEGGKGREKGGREGGREGERRGERRGREGREGRVVKVGRRRESGEGRRWERIGCGRG